MPPPAAYLRAASDFDQSGRHCTKIPYLSRREALKVARAQAPAQTRRQFVGSAKNLGALNVYPCSECAGGVFHVGHWPQKGDKAGRAKAKQALAKLKASKRSSGGGRA